MSGTNNLSGTFCRHCGQRQAQANPARRARGKKRIEYILACFRIHAPSIVGKLNPQNILRPFANNRQCQASRACCQRILGQVQDVK